ADLRARLERMLVAYTYANEPVYARDLGVCGAMTLLLKDALNPNLVQTLENSPALMHGGPFANIAHGCNSLRATKLALKLGDYAITEAGFGSDLGAEKFLHIKCRAGGFVPSCVVIVATVRALKHNGGGDLAAGYPNLQTHVENMQGFGLPVVVALNRFADDTDEEIAFLRANCPVPIALCEVFAHGGAGGEELAKLVIEACAQPANYVPLYDLEDGIKQKLHKIATTLYRADGVQFTPAAEKSLKRLVELGYDNLPVCVAKTPASLSDDPAKLGSPRGHSITVRDVTVSAGAGFVVAYTGDIMVMPGLPKTPAACRMDIDDDGTITGLF
ncbi:MAG: formate--tetrahydrofolate ligase, partial [Oscillospiraceae bacterium]|nr:formate--tetrahydrofolate ligase [Oscillospiraceae bacterium]